MFQYALVFVELSEGQDLGIEVVKGQGPEKGGGTGQDPGKKSESDRGQRREVERGQDPEKGDATDQSPERGGLSRRKKRRPHEERGRDLQK